MRKVTGDVQEIRCDACGAAIHNFLFAGEDDAETAGLCSAGRCNISDIVIAEATPEEWNAFDEDGLVILEERLTKKLNLPGLKISRLLRVEQPNGSVAGRSFQHFLRVYKPPTLVYVCPCCEQGEARVAAKYTINEFHAGGGKLTIVGDISVE